MMLEPDMRSYLAASTATSADDYYLRVAPQQADYPYGVIFKVSPGKDYTHSGSGLSQSRMQCSCYAGSYRAAKTLASEVISVMEVWPAAESKVHAVFLAGETDLFEERTYHIALDFFVWHTY
jgi:hypothetical protein